MQVLPFMWSYSGLCHVLLWIRPWWNLTESSHSVPFFRLLDSRLATAGLPTSGFVSEVPGPSWLTLPLLIVLTPVRFSDFSSLHWLSRVSVLFGVLKVLPQCLFSLLKFASLGWMLFLTSRYHILAAWKAKKGQSLYVFWWEQMMCTKSGWCDFSFSQY